jgi:hypothetical protein
MVIPKVQLRPEVPGLMAVVIEMYEENKHKGLDPCMGHYPQTRVP